MAKSRFLVLATAISVAVLLGAIIRKPHGATMRSIEQELKQSGQNDIEGSRHAALEEMNDVARQLIAGRLTLHEAAKQFDKVEPLCIKRAVQFAEPKRWDSEAERLCRFVIVRVEVVLDELGLQQSDIPKKLEEELQAEIRLKGGVILSGD